MTVSPDGFGLYSDRLLVGNHGDGVINVYSFKGKHLDVLRHKTDLPITVDGLWGLASTDEVIYFSAGSNEDGLLGKIRLRDKSGLT